MSQGIGIREATLRLRIGSVLLVVWGLINAVGGVAAGRQHPSPLIAPMFAIIGALMVAGGVAFGRRKTWSVVLTLLALAALSGAALLSGYLLRGWSGMNVSHHLVRVVISGLVFAVAFSGLRRERAQAVASRAPSSG